MWNTYLQLSLTFSCEYCISTFCTGNMFCIFDNGKWKAFFCSAWVICFAYLTTGIGRNFCNPDDFLWRGWCQGDNHGIKIKCIVWYLNHGVNCFDWSVSWNWRKIPSFKMIFIVRLPYSGHTRRSIYYRQCRVSLLLFRMVCDSCRKVCSSLSQ